MQKVIKGSTDSFGQVARPDIRPPYAADWNELFDLLLK